MSGALFESNNGVPKGLLRFSGHGPVWTINQQVMSPKSLASTLAIVGKFRSV